MTIRIRLKEQLARQMWTQKYLAQITNLRPNVINDMYHEMTERVNLDYLDRICEAFDCEITDILERVPNKKRKIKQK